jgi:hypothetical protein
VIRITAENKRGKYRASLAWIFVMLAVVSARAWTQSPQTALEAKPGEVILHLDPAQSKLHWALGSTLHTVHGTFALKRGAVRFNPASGSAIDVNIRQTPPVERAATRDVTRKCIGRF